MLESSPPRVESRTVIFTVQFRVSEQDRSITVGPTKKLLKTLPSTPR